MGSDERKPGRWVWVPGAGLATHDVHGMPMRNSRGEPFVEPYPIEVGEWVWVEGEGKAGA